MKRYERRQEERAAGRKPLPPRPAPRDPDRCDVCRENIAQGALCRTLIDVNGHLPTIYGHAPCIDQVIAHNVEVNGGKDLGDLGGAR